MDDPENPLFGKDYKGGRYQDPKKESETKVSDDVPSFFAEPLKAFMAKKFKPLDYIWENFVAKGDFVLIAGETGIGKTLITMLMTYFLSQGKNFANLLTVMARKVFYIDAEMAQQDFQERLRKVYEEHGLMDNFHYLNCLEKEEFIDLTNPYHRDALFEILEDLHIDIVVLDNLFALSSIKDFRRPEEFIEGMKPFIHGLRKRGISCILLDHLNKEGSVFGSIAKIVFVDTVLKLEKIEEGAFEFEVIKNRRQGLKSKVSFTVTEDNKVSYRDSQSFASQEQFILWMENNYSRYYPKPHITKKSAIEAMFLVYEDKYKHKPFMSAVSYLKNYSVNWTNN